ncbi:MAG: DUF4147 domain-containing protein, partial [Proteobacteria bacterium]
MIKDAKRIFKAAVESVDPYHLLADVELPKTGFSRIKMFAVGKASEAMAKAVIEQLGDRLDSGLVIVKEIQNLTFPKNVRTFESSHPVPDQRSLEAGKLLMQFCETAQVGELVVGLISGGASSLVEVLKDGVSLDDLQKETSRLLAGGADIQALNAARKRLSKIKGGQLAQMIQPASSINFILSDVIGNDLNTIASGLTALAAHESQLTNTVIGSNETAVAAAKREAEALGYETRVLPDPICGEASLAGAKFASYARELLNHSSTKPLCIIAGGETVVTVRGEGKGGRNQELALSYLSHVMTNKHLGDSVFLSGATDGGDGPTD